MEGFSIAGTISGTRDLVPFLRNFGLFPQEELGVGGSWFPDLWNSEPPPPEPLGSLYLGTRFPNWFHVYRFGSQKSEVVLFGEQEPFGWLVELNADWSNTSSVRVVKDANCHVKTAGLITCSRTDVPSLVAAFVT